MSINRDMKKYTLEHRLPVRTPSGATHYEWDKVKEIQKVKLMPISRSAFDKSLWNKTTMPSVILCFFVLHKRENQNNSTFGLVYRCG